jgi:hypothetical protein
MAGHCVLLAKRIGGVILQRCSRAFTMLEMASIFEVAGQARAQLIRDREPREILRTYSS